MKKTLILTGMVVLIIIIVFTFFAPIRQKSYSGKQACLDFVGVPVSEQKLHIFKGQLSKYSNPSEGSCDHLVIYKLYF